MKILAIADKESKSLWDYYQPGKLDGIDLIISCGDLESNYLQFLATFSHAPILYVHGNHDDHYEENPPDGCVSIEDRIYVYEGIRILGLGGSVRYKRGEHQYSQSEMRFRVMKLWFQLKKYKGFDILVTHAPAYGVGDGEDAPHRGFEAFIELLEKYSPKYFLHGHVHTNYGRRYQKYNCFGDTLIINAYETHLFEYETEAEKNLLKTRKKKEAEAEANLLKTKKKEAEAEAEENLLKTKKKETS